MQVKNKGKIITVTSTKGGVGKTITTLNLAGVYSLMKKKVLIIDSDLYGGNIATFVNSTNEKSLFNLVEDYTFNRYKSLDEYLYSYNEYISIIAAPKDPRMANKIDDKYIPLILENVIYKYDVILVDSTHNLNETSIITLDNSDVILYIFTNDTFDLKNTRSFLSIVKNAGFNNVYTLLNESINVEKGYYSLFDIRSIIKSNINFTLSKSFHIRNIDKYILEGKIFTLNPNLNLLSSKEGKNFMAMAEELLENKSINKEVK